MPARTKAPAAAWTAALILCGLVAAATAATAAPPFEVAAITAGEPPPPAVLSTCKEAPAPKVAGAAPVSRCLRSPDRRSLLFTTAPAAAGAAGQPGYLLAAAPSPLPVQAAGRALLLGADAVWSRDGRRLAAVGRTAAAPGGNQPYLVDARTGAATAAGTVEGEAFRVEWCGRTALFVLTMPHPEESGDLDVGDLYLLDTANHAARRLSTGRQLLVAACSPDGSLIAAADAAGQRLLLWSAAARPGPPPADFYLPGREAPGHREDQIKRLAWTSASTLTVVTAAFDGTAWSGERTFTLRRPLPRPHR